MDLTLPAGRESISAVEAVSAAEIGDINIKPQIMSSQELWKNPKRGPCSFNSSQSSVPLFKHLSSLKKRFANMTDRTTTVRACTGKWKRRNSVPAETVPAKTCSGVLTGHPLATPATCLTTPAQEPALDHCWSFRLAWGGNKNASVPLHQRPDTGQGGERRGQHPNKLK